MHRGTVKWFNAEKGFGFIEYEGGDIFVHRSSLDQLDNLTEGQIVVFEIFESIRGNIAINVKEE